MHSGKIIKFSDRGSGFIKEDGSKEELFFDSSDLVGVSFKDLRIGDTLAFLVTKSLKGPYATRVSKLLQGKGAHSSKSIRSEG
ncbi:MAG TPA: cold shock domain-containing protein [Candidatus Paceibacterota bacterium]|jgi:cold shock CspA family protein|nr:cold shock domain-containing protein [Candidatus Paceibacterota bacterium]